MLNKDFISKSNTKRYKRMFSITKDYNWITKFASETSSDALEFLSVSSPTLGSFVKSLIKANSSSDKDKTQALVGKVIANALAEHYTSSYDSDLPIFTTWKYKDPDQSLDNFVLADDSTTLDSIRKYIPKFLSVLKPDDSKKIKKILADDQNLRNALRYSIIRGYDHVYELFNWNNPIVGLIPQTTVFGNIPLSKKEAARKKIEETGAEPKKEFILRSTIGPRLDDLLVGLRIGMAGAVRHLQEEIVRSKGRPSQPLDEAYKSVAIFSAHIDYIEKGLNALKDFMSVPRHKTLRYASKAGSDLLTENPYIANIDGLYTYVGIGEFVRSGISSKELDKAQYKISYTNWAGEVDFWSKPTPANAMVSEHFIQNVVAKPQFAYSIALQSILSFAHQNEQMSMSIDQEDLALKMMKMGVSPSVSEEAVIDVYKKARRFLAQELHGLVQNLKENPDTNPYTEYQRVVESLKRKIVENNASVIADDENSRSFRSGVNALILGDISNIASINKPDVLYYTTKTGTVKSKVSQGEVSTWKKAKTGAREIPQIMKSSYFSSKYVKNQEDYDKWMEQYSGSSDLQGYVDTIQKDLARIDDEVYTKLGLAKPRQDVPFDMDFLSSLRDLFKNYPTLESLQEALGDINHSALFIKLGRDLLSSFSKDLQFQVGLSYNKDAVQGGLSSAQSFYDPLVGKLTYGFEDLDENEEEDAKEAFKRVETKMKKGLGKFEFRTKLLMNPDADIERILQAIETGDVVEYFDELISEIRPAKRLHEKYGIPTLNTQSIGGVLEKIYLDENANVNNIIGSDKEGADIFYRYISYRLKNSMGKYIWDRNRSHLAEFWNSGRPGAPDGLNHMMELVGAFADPIKYRKKQEEGDGVAETAVNAFWRAASKVGKVPDHLLVETYKNYFRDMENAYLAQSSKLKSLIVKFNRDHYDATNDPFNKHPEILKLKREIEFKLQETGQEIKPSSWITVLMGGLDPNDELGKVSKEFDPTFDPQNDEEYKDVANFNSKDSLDLFIDKLPSYILTNEERQDLKTQILQKLKDEDFLDIKAFEKALVNSLKKNEVKVSNKNDLLSFIEYVAEVKYSEEKVIENQIEDSSSAFDSRVKQLMSKVERMKTQYVTESTALSVLKDYLINVEKLMEETTELIDEGDAILEEDLDGDPDLEDLIGSLDSKAFSELEILKERIEDAISDAEYNDSQELPLSTINLTEPDVYVEPEEIPLSTIELEPEQIEDKQPSPEVVDFSEDIEEDIPLSTQPKLDAPFDDMSLDEEDNLNSILDEDKLTPIVNDLENIEEDKDFLYESNSPWDEPTIETDMIWSDPDDVKDLESDLPWADPNEVEIDDLQIPEKNMFSQEVSKIKQYLTRPELLEMEDVDLIKFNADKFAEMLSNLSESEIVKKDVANTLKNQLNMMFNFQDPYLFAKWFNEKGFDDIPMLYYNLIVGPSKKANVDVKTEILKTTSNNKKTSDDGGATNIILKPADDDEEYYYF